MVKIQKTVWMLCLLMAAGLTMTFSASALARAPINSDDGGVTIKGYDAVAYFTEGAPVRGDPAHEHEWQGARWQFSSAEHRDLFAAEPDRYAPRYGGFCSGAMALGWKFRADPKAWKIIDGARDEYRISYLFLDELWRGERGRDA